MHDQLKQTGFKKINIQMVRPRFLTGKNKHIVSLLLENLSSKLIEEKIASPTEIQALLFELKDFENKQYTMITLPGIFQTCAYKIKQ